MKKKKNKKFIDNNDVMSTINKKKFIKFDDDHRFLESERINDG